MGRRPMELGTHGEVLATPQMLVDGLWKKAPNAKSATRWRGRCYYRGQDGLRDEVTRFARLKKDAEADVLEAVQHLLNAGDGRMTATMPLKDAGELWITQITRPDAGLADRTLEAYVGNYRRAVMGPASSLRGLTLVQANDPQRLRGYLQRLADQHGTGTAKMSRSVLNGILQLAVDNGVVPTNALLQVGKVKAVEKKVSPYDNKRAFTREERGGVLAHAYAQAEVVGLSPRTARLRWARADLAALMAGTGTRIEEARMLRWEWLDWDTSVLAVRAVKGRNRDEPDIRMVDLPAWLMERLKARSVRVGTSGLIVGAPNALATTEQKWDRSNNARVMRALLDDAGVEWAVPHTFRRTVVTWLHQAGFPLARIADQVGHEDVDTTLIYLGRDKSGSKKDMSELL